MSNPLHLDQLRGLDTAVLTEAAATLNELIEHTWSMHELFLRAKDVDGIYNTAIELKAVHESLRLVKEILEERKI